jgi:hypothetical protein
MRCIAWCMSESEEKDTAFETLYRISNGSFISSGATSDTAILMLMASNIRRIV